MEDTDLILNKICGVLIFALSICYGFAVGVVCCTNYITQDDQHDTIIIGATDHDDSAL